MQSTGAHETDRAARGQMEGGASRPQAGSPAARSPAAVAGVARGRLQSAVRAVQVAQRSGRPLGDSWNNMAHVKPHLVMRSAAFRRAERNSAGKTRPKKAEVKRSDHEVVAFLNDVGLQQHYPRIKKLGAVDPRELRDLSPLDLDEVRLKQFRTV